MVTVKEDEWRIRAVDTDGNLTTSNVNATNIILAINQSKTTDALDSGLTFNTTSCTIDFQSSVSPGAEDILHLEATVTKGNASLTKSFMITFE